MKLASLALLLLALSACSAPRVASQEGAAVTPRTRDMMCVDDCLGTGGTRSFCEERCSN